MAIGVEVTTSLRSGPSNPGPVSGRLHIAGLTERGPVDRAELVKSIAQFESIYGVRTPYASNVYDSARTFFEEGGSELVVARAVGPAATTGFLVLKDTADVDTVRIQGSDPGAHSSSVTVEVVNGAGKYTVTVRKDGVLVGLFRDLVTPGDLVTAASSNTFIDVTDLGSVTAAPGNQPKTLAPAALSAGADDRAAITAAVVAAALDKPSPNTRGGAVAAPGYPASTIGSLLIAHAKATGKIALLSPAEGATPEQAALDAENLIGADGSFAGMFYPHIVIPDGSGTRTLSPEAFVGAVRSRAHLANGFWQVPAGSRSLPRWIVGTVRIVDRIQNNTLAESQLNGITTIGGKPRLYGWASLSTDAENLGLLSAQDTLNNLGFKVEEALEEFVFTTIDAKGFLLSRIEAAVTGVIDPIQVAGGFFPLFRDGDQVDPGYKVTVDQSINTATSMANNEVLVSISVRMAPVAALIKAEIIKVALTASV
jgi:hypothetical protein